MKRAIVQPADVSGAPLDELKQWLGITRENEDSQLIDLLQASLEYCEAFTGQIPIEVTCEEKLAANRHWYRLSSRPVRAITAMDQIEPDGTRLMLAVDDYRIEIDSDAIGRVQLTRSIESELIVVTYDAGLAEDWDNLPTALRHGIIRLAAHYYGSRDNREADTLPAAVAALWRPWRQVRI